MASLWDLVVRVMGNSAQFREDMEQDKTVLDDFVNSVHDLNIDVNLDDADAEAKLEAFKAELDSIRDKSSTIDVHDEDAKLRIREVKDKLDEIRNATADINVHDEDAKAKIDEIKLKLDDIRNATSDIKIDDADAKMKLDEMKARLDELRDAHSTIEVNDADAKAKIDDIKLKLDDIRDAHSKIDLEDAEAVVKLDELDKKLDGIEERIITINNTPVDPKVNNRNVDQAGQQWSWLAGTIMTLLPAISPLAAVAAGGIGLIGTSLTAATAGAAGFGVVAKSAITDVTTAQGKLKSAQDAVNQAEAQVKGAKTYQQWLVATENLQKAQQALAQAQSGVGAQTMQAVNALNQFESFWKSFTSSFKPTVLSAFTDGLRTLEDLLKDFSPVISAAGKAIDQIIKNMDSGLKSSSMESFFNTLAKTTGPALLAWATAAGNIFKGLAGVFQAFAPYLGGFNKGLDSVTASFARWGQQLGSSNGFKQFMDYVKQEAPQVGKLIMQLGTFVMEALKAMAPAGAILLPVINGILGLVNAVLKANPLVGEFGVAIMQGIGIMKLLSPVISAVMTGIRMFATAFVGASAEAGTAIEALSGPIGWIVAAIVAAAVLIISHWSQIRKFFSDLWSGIKQDWSTGWDQIKQMWNNLSSNIIHLVEGVWNGVTKWFSDLWNGILQDLQTGWQSIQSTWDSLSQGIIADAQGIWNGITGWFGKLWGDVKSGVITGWTNIKSTVSTWAGDAYSAITGVFDQLGGYFANLWNEAVSWGENLVNSIAKGISNAIGAVTGAVSNVVNTIGDFLHFRSPTRKGEGSTLNEWMPNMMKTLVKGIESGIPAVHAALNQVIIPPSSAQMMTAASGYAQAAVGHTLQVQYNQNAPVYGVNDLNAAIQQGVNSGISKFVSKVKTTGRAMGVST